MICNYRFMFFFVFSEFYFQYLRPFNIRPVIYTLIYWAMPFFDPISVHYNTVVKWHFQTYQLNIYILYFYKNKQFFSSGMEIVHDENISTKFCLKYIYYFTYSFYKQCFISTVWLKIGWNLSNCLASTKSHFDGYPNLSNTFTFVYNKGCCYTWRVKRYTRPEDVHTFGGKWATEKISLCKC